MLADHPHHLWGFAGWRGFQTAAQRRPDLGKGDATGMT
jgi:hypothetical protein